MSYGLAQTTAPTLEPLTLVEVKQHLRLPVEVTDDDSLLTAQLAAARADVEDRTNRQLVTATWTLKADSFPYSTGIFILPRAPLATVTSITYLEAVAGVSTTWSSANYIVATTREPGEVSLAYGCSFPSVYPIANAVTVVFTAGSAVASVNVKAKQAIKLKLSEWHAATPMEAEGCRKAYEALISSLNVGDEFHCYDPAAEVYA
jgi:uncharacterized phiE125 gp8 family phage protein